jgi:PAS domain S-box-containing protein
MTTSTNTWPPGSSRIGAIIRAKDWSLTPLGAIDTWPPSLRIAVTNVMDCPMASIVLWGPELIQIYNDAYQPILGHRHPLALGQPTAECWSDVWQFNEPIYKRVTSAGQAVHLVDQEFVLDTLGSVRAHHFTLTYSPARDETGNVRGITVTVVETSDRVRLKRENVALARSWEMSRRQEAFSVALATAMRASVDPGNFLVEASRMLGLELGATRVLYCEISTNATTFDIRHQWSADGAKSAESAAGRSRNFPSYGEAFTETLRSGRTVVVADVDSDERTSALQRKYARMRVKAFLAIPLLRGGQLSAVLTVHRENSYAWDSDEVALCEKFVEKIWAAAENAKAQAALRAERDQSNAVFDSMTEGFGLVDKNWTVIRMNEAGFTIGQRTAEQVIGKNHWDVWPEVKDSELARLYDVAKEKRAPGMLEYLHSPPNGLATWVEIRAYPTPEDGFAFFFRDVSARKFAEAKLVEADRRKDEFLAMLAHELRNPLAPISAAASLLTMGHLDEHLVKKTSEIIARQVRHMSSLVDDLLDVSRVTRGLIELDKIVIDVKRIVADAVEQVRPQFEARNHRLTLSLSYESTFVLGDQKRLVQVVANLLNNAAKYTPENGNIVVSTAVSDDTVTISVADNGVGMSQSLLDRAFDLFAQESRTSDRAQGGLGLGLSLVKSLVVLHGGDVAAKSGGHGEGSEFTVHVPRVSAPEIYKSATSEGPVKGGNALHVLVVDDNKDAASTLAMLLQALGHTVVVALDGHQALEQARQESFDVCLLDIGLPDMTGNDLALRIRAQAPLEAVTLIAVTGYGQKQDMEKSAASGFDFHMVKPVDIRRLTTLVGSINARKGVEHWPGKQQNFW